MTNNNQNSHESDVFDFTGFVEQKKFEHSEGACNVYQFLVEIGKEAEKHLEIANEYTDEDWNTLVSDLREQDIGVFGPLELEDDEVAGINRPYVKKN